MQHFDTHSGNWTSAMLGNASAMRTLILACYSPAMLRERFISHKADCLFSNIGHALDDGLTETQAAWLGYEFLMGISSEDGQPL